MSYAKAVAAILGAGVVAALGIFTSGPVYDGLTIALAVLTAVGVYVTPNKP